jgi:hypothetical protein
VLPGKGNLAQLTWISRYFLTCVQQHMEHHGDEYYREGVDIRNRVGLVMSAVEKARRGADSTVPILAEADKLLQLGKRKSKMKDMPRTPRTTIPPPLVEPEPAPSPVIKMRKLRSGSLMSQLSIPQRREVWNRLFNGASYEAIVALCASWGISTSKTAAGRFWEQAQTEPFRANIHGTSAPIT